MKKVNYFEMPTLDVYNMVLKGELKKFPNNYLDKNTVKELVRYVVLSQCKYTREDVIEKLNHKFFQERLLGGARIPFDKCENEMIIYCFPEWNIKHWELRKTSPKFWMQPKNQKDFVLWVAEKEGIDLATKEGLRSFTVAHVQKYGGHKAIKYAGGMFELLNTVNCNKYQEWEITKVASWSDEKIVQATKWLIEKKLKYTPEQVCNIKVADFQKYNLDGMLQKGCNHSILYALDLTYPGKYTRDGIRGIRLVK